MKLSLNVFACFSFLTQLLLASGPHLLPLSFSTFYTKGAQALPILSCASVTSLGPKIHLIT